MPVALLRLTIRRSVVKPVRVALERDLSAKSHAKAWVCQSITYPRAISAKASYSVLRTQRRPKDIGLLERLVGPFSSERHMCLRRPPGSLASHLHALFPLLVAVYLLLKTSFH